MSINRCLNIHSPSYRKLWSNFQQDELLTRDYPTQRDFQALVVTWQEYHHDEEIYPTVSELHEFRSTWESNQYRYREEASPAGGTFEGYEPGELEEIAGIFFQEHLTSLPVEEPLGEIARLGSELIERLPPGQLLFNTHVLDDDDLPLLANYMTMILSEKEMAELHDAITGLREEKHPGEVTPRELAGALSSPGLHDHPIHARINRRNRLVQQLINDPARQVLFSRLYGTGVDNGTITPRLSFRDMSVTRVDRPSRYMQASNRLTRAFTFDELEAITRSYVAEIARRFRDPAFSGLDDGNTTSVLPVNKSLLRAAFQAVDDLLLAIPGKLLVNFAERGTVVAFPLLFQRAGVAEELALSDEATREKARTSPVPVLLSLARAKREREIRAARELNRAGTPVAIPGEYTERELFDLLIEIAGDIPLRPRHATTPSVEASTRGRFRDYLNNISRLRSHLEDIHVFVAPRVGEMLGIKIDTDYTPRVQDARTNMNDDTSVDDIDDSVNDGSENTREHWMTHYREIAVRDTMTWRVRLALSTLEMPLIPGTRNVNFFGLGKTMTLDEVKNVLLYHLQGTIDSEEMLGDLRALSRGYPWVNEILAAFEKDNALEVQFWGVFRKEATRYDNLTVKPGNEGGKKISLDHLNRSPVASKYLTRWKSTIRHHDVLDLDYSIYTFDGQLTGNDPSVPRVAGIIAGFLKKYNEITRQPPASRAVDLDTLWNTIREEDALSRLLKGVGIVPDMDLLTRGYLANSEKFLGELLDSLNALYALAEWHAAKPSPITIEKFYKDQSNVSSPYTRLATLFAGSTLNSLEEHVYVKGKPVYSYVQPSYLTTLVKRLGNIRLQDNAAYLEWLASEYGGQTRDGYVSTLLHDRKQGYRVPWLQALHLNADNNRALFQHKVMLSYNKEKYNDFGEQGYLLAMIYNYLNPGGKKDFAWFAVPVLSDAPSMEFVQFKKAGSQRVILEELFKLFLHEIDRVNLITERQKMQGIPHVDNLDTGGTRFILFPWMDDPAYVRVREQLLGYHAGILSNPVNRSGEREGDSRLFNLFKDTQSDYMKLRERENRARFERLGLLDTWRTSSDGPVHYTYFPGESRDSLEKLLENFFWENYHAQMNLLMLTVGDPACYKNVTDLNKRIKEIHAPGQLLYLPARYNGSRVGKSTERYISVADIEESSTDEFLAAIDDIITRNNKLSASEKAYLKSRYHEPHVLTDGQTYRTLESWRSIVSMYRGWTDAQEKAYNNLYSGQFSMDDYNVIWQAIKPYIFTTDLVDSNTKNAFTGDTIHFRLGYQRKNAEALLLPHLFKHVKSRQLQALHDVAVAHGIDAIVFHSCEKTGGRAMVVIPRAFPGDTHEKLFSDIIKANPAAIKTLKLRDYKIQTPVPEHILDSSILFGSQARVILPANFLPGETINLDGTEMEASEAMKLYDDLITENIKESLRDLLDRVGTIEKLQELLASEILGSTRYSRDLLQAINIVEIHDNTGKVIDKRFNIPLSDPVHRSRVQQLLNSVWKKQINRQRIAGGTTVQVSSYGVSSDLKIETYKDSNGETRLGNVEIMAPFYTSILTPRLKEIMLSNDGYLPVEQLLAEGIIEPEFLEGIAYRTPTEGKHSILPFKIVRFLPRATGGNVIGPNELPLIMGIDFDIDKLNMILPVFTVNARGEFRVARFPGGDLSKASKEERDNKLLRLSRAMLLSKGAEGQRLSTSGFDNLKKASRILQVLESPVLAGNYTLEQLESMSLAELERITDARQPDWFEYGTQLDFYRANTVAASLIGIFANASIGTLKRQRLGPREINGEKIPGIHLRPVIPGDPGSRRFNLDGKTDLDNPGVLHATTLARSHRLASSGIMEYLAASLDAVKDPVLAFMGIDKQTINVALTLVALDYSPVVVGLFSRQPAIRWLLADLAREQLPLSVKAIEDKISQVKRRVKEIRGEEKGTSPGTPVLPRSRLAGDITYHARPGGNETTDLPFLERQGQVLDAFLSLFKIGQELSTLTLAMKPDAGYPGPSLMHTLEKVGRARDAFSMDESREIFVPPALHSHASRREGNVSSLASRQLELVELEKNELGFIQGFFSAGFLANLDFMTRHFVEGTRGMRDIFNKVLLEMTRLPALPSELASSLANNFISYYLGQYPFFDISSEESKTFIEQFPSRLEGMVQEPYLSGLQLFRRVTRVDNTVQYDGFGGVTRDMTDTMIQEWESLATSSREEYRELARDLFRYAFFTSDVGFGHGAFMHLVPSWIRSRLPVTPGGLAYSDIISLALKYLNTGMSNDALETFLLQYVMNHSNDKTIVPLLGYSNVVSKQVSEKKNHDALLAGEVVKLNFPDRVPGELRGHHGLARRFFRVAHLRGNPVFQVYNQFHDKETGVIILDIIALKNQVTSPFTGGSPGEARDEDENLRYRDGDEETFRDEDSEPEVTGGFPVDNISPVRYVEESPVDSGALLPEDVVLMGDSEVVENFVHSLSVIDKEEENSLPLQGSGRGKSRGGNKMTIEMIINEKGEIDYEELERAADAVESGRVRLDRLLLGMEAQRSRIGRAGIEASLVALAARARDLSRDDSEGSSSAQYPQSKEDRERIERETKVSQEEALIKWAKHKGIFLDRDEIFSTWEDISSGEEAFVFFGETPGTVRKVVSPYAFSSSPVDFIDNRLVVFNYLFPRTAYKLTGLTTDPGSKIAFILEQEYVQGESIWSLLSTDKTIGDRFLKEMERGGLSLFHGKVATYTNDKCIVTDLHGKNVLVDPNGEFRVIDAVTSLNTDQRFGGNQEYGNGEIVEDDSMLRYREDYEEKTGISFNNEQIKYRDGQEETREAGLGNRQRMVDSALRELVGGQEKGSRIYQAIQAGHDGGGYRATAANQQIPWDAERFLGAVEVAAKANGAWIEDIRSISRKSIGRGTENEVYLSKDGKHVIKINNLSLADDFNDFIERLDGHNKLFGRDVSYKIIGISENSNGEVGIVLEQPYVIGTDAKQEVIDNYLFEHGFVLKREQGVKAWYIQKYRVSDTYPRNVLENNSGDLFFIDPIIDLGASEEVLPDNTYDGIPVDGLPADDASWEPDWGNSRDNEVGDAFQTLLVTGRELIDRYSVSPALLTIEELAEEASIALGVARGDIQGARGYLESLLNKRRLESLAMKREEAGKKEESSRAAIEARTRRVKKAAAGAGVDPEPGETPLLDKLGAVPSGVIREISSRLGISLEALEPVSELVMDHPALESSTTWGAHVASAINSVLFGRGEQALYESLGSLVLETGVPAADVFQAVSDVKENYIDESVLKCS